MTERETELRDNYLSVLEKIENAKARRGGDKPVTLLAASKMNPAGDICFLAENCGLKLCGENTAKEFGEKYDSVTRSGAEMDFIGHLQTNKVRLIVGRARLIHSLDSMHLAEEINSRAEKLGVVQPVLVEVNIGEESSKTGVLPSMVEEFLDRIQPLSHLEVRGMMTMAPKCDEKEEFRKYFRESSRIFIDIFTKKSHNIREPLLSMGMSDSFETAIEEGADIVRVGSRIFGTRNYNK